MDKNLQSQHCADATDLLTHRVRIALVTTGVLAIVAVAVVAWLWSASFFMYASLRQNPFHAGFWGWPGAFLVWHDGLMPGGGRRLAGSALLGAFVAVGCPAIHVYSVWERTGRRLYGSSRFASEAEIRAAGLL